MHQKEDKLEEEILNGIDFYEEECDKNPCLGNLTRLHSYRMMYYNLRFEETNAPVYKILYDIEKAKK